MTTVLAAVDTSAIAPHVLETALAIAELMGGTVRAVHVHDGPIKTMKGIPTHSSIPLSVLEGPVEQTLLEAIAAPSVDAAVVGARGTPNGRRPTGHTALDIVQHARKPIVIVPPYAIGRPPRRIRRLLLPLEGTEESSQPVTDPLRPLLASDVDLTVLHVFTAATTPRMLDRPGRDLALLADEFAARHCPAAERVEMRTGSVGDRVADACREEAVDLVVLSWSQDMSAGHAEIVQDVLSRSPVPVLLLPVADP